MSGEWNEGENESSRDSDQWVVLAVRDSSAGCQRTNLQTFRKTKENNNKTSFILYNNKNKQKRKQNEKDFQQVKEKKKEE